MKLSETMSGRESLYDETNISSLSYFKKEQIVRAYTKAK